ncbi:hypothetical protein SAMN05880592_12243 [Bosea sp. TND4EK4]|nr:hypothetical protein SAMN05880592_12243 [Bosea sp. TND4EK4]
MHATGLEHAPSSRLAGPSRSSGSPSSFRSLTGPPAGLKAPCLKPSKHVHADHRSVLVPSPTSSTITLNQPAGATSHHTRFNQVRNRSSWAKRASDCPEADVSRVRKGPRPEASRRGGLGLRQTKSYRYFKHISVRSFILNGAPFSVKAGHHGASVDVSLNETFRESLLRAENADFVGADDHAIDEQMQPSAAECRVSVAQPPPYLS